MDKELVKKLDAIGLTKSEAQIYLAVLEIGQTGISSIAEKTSINRRNIYDSISTLLDKGLIFQIISEREGKYGAVEPDKLVELIQSKEIALARILPDLDELFGTKKIREQAVIYKGIEGFRNFMQDILNTGQDVYCMGAKGGWGSKELGSFADWFEKERIRKKIKVYNLFDEEMRPAIKKKPLYSVFGEHRFLAKEFSTNSAVDIFGDKVVTFTGLYKEKFDEDVTLFVLTSPELAEAWRVWFRLLWENSNS
ncbi:hypothetical protein KKF61_02610 [Patescibacteria group bacterium]|nr:hypothetical protein [Patescibacteria group bacterium]MBU0963820.1 hypothetical protein [Patescibacteria group bacterium]